MNIVPGCLMFNHTFQGDNTGDNISKKNPHYNELTALYWGWKNLDVDALGLVHYRRYLTMGHSKDLSTILNHEQVEELLTDADVILPKKRHYYIETNESHYLHVHEHEPLEITRQVLKKKYPQYLPAFEKVMKQTSAHYFNMMIMKKKPLDEYCTWLFDVLGEVEKKVDYSDYTPYEQRVFGFLSELLLDTWLLTNPQYKTVEVNRVFLEVEKKVDYSDYTPYEQRVFGFLSELLLDTWLLTNPQYKTVEVNRVFLEKQNWPLKIAKFLKRKVTGHGEH